MRFFVAVFLSLFFTITPVCYGKMGYDPVWKLKVEYGIKRSDDPNFIKKKLSGSSFIYDVSSSKKDHNYKIVVNAISGESKKFVSEKIRRATIYAIVTIFAVSDIKDSTLTVEVQLSKDLVDKHPKFIAKETFQLNRKKVDTTLKSLLGKDSIEGSHDMWVQVIQEDGVRFDALAPEYDKLTFLDAKPGLDITFSEMTKL